MHPTEPDFSSDEYQTMVVGAGYMIKGILQRLRVVEIIDQVLCHQPIIETTYGKLAPVIIINRLAFDPQPLYRLSEWAERHGIGRLLGIEAKWLDDDRMGALLEALADHQVTIWSAIVREMMKKYGIEMERLYSDTTSVYFEGAYEKEGGDVQVQRLPQIVKGYNKDGKPQKVQMVLSLITTGRLPVWYRPWDGNQTDEAVYLADMTALKKHVLVPENSILIGDRKLCTQENMRAFCRQGQQFLAPHPWTPTAKAVWLETWACLQQGELTWTDVDYVSRNNAHKLPEHRPKYTVCEVSHEVKDPEKGQNYSLRWVFVKSNQKAKRDAERRERAIQKGEAALQRIAGLLGKYDYTTRGIIAHRIERGLGKARAKSYFIWELKGSEETQDWQLTWHLLEDRLAEAQRFDGIALLCTNVPESDLSAGEVMKAHKQQIHVEQTIDFIKSPVQIRPMWLHSPKRIAGLTLLIMIAVLVAALLEYQVRRWIAKTGKLVQGLMPEKRDNTRPTARSLLRAFADYVLIMHRHRGREEICYPKFRPVQQQIWDIMDAAPFPAKP